MKMHHYIFAGLFFIFLITFFSCEQQNSEPYYLRKSTPYGTSFSPQEVVEAVTDTDRFVLPYAPEFYNGYTNIYFPESNRLAGEGNYENGSPSGYWKFYYVDGKKRKEGNFDNGYLSGYWKFYYDNGLKKEEGNYENNVRTGYWHFYHENGKKSSEGNYSNGNKQGEWKYFNEDGQLESTEVY